MNSREAVMLLILLVITEAFLVFPSILVDEGGTSAWMIMVTATIVAMAAFLPMAVLLHKYSGKSLIEIGKDIVGPFLNFFFSLAYLFFFIVSTALILRQYAERTITVSIPGLPISVAVLGMLLGALVACYLGLEAIARSAYIIGYLVLFGILMMGVLPYQYWNFDYFLPIFESGLFDVLYHGFIRSTVMGEVLFLALVFPLLKGGSAYKVGLWGLGLGGLVMTVLLAAVQVAFPASVFQEFSLPTFELSRLVYLGRFVQRLEPVFMPLWALVGLVRVSLGCYIIASVLARMFGLPYYRPFIFPSLIITAAVAFIPANVVEVAWFDNNVVRVYGGFVPFFLPAVLLAVHLLLNRLQVRKKNDNTQGI